MQLSLGEGGALLLGAGALCRRSALEPVALNWGSGGVSCWAEAAPGLEDRRVDTSQLGSIAQAQGARGWCIERPRRGCRAAR